MSLFLEPACLPVWLFLLAKASSDTLRLVSLLVPLLFDVVYRVVVVVAVFSLCGVKIQIRF